MEVSLADFTLELHSHKTRRAIMFEDLARRLAMQPQRLKSDLTEIQYDASVADLAEAAEALGAREHEDAPHMQRHPVRRRRGGEASRRALPRPEERELGRCAPRT